MSATRTQMVDLRSPQLFGVGNPDSTGLSYSPLHLGVGNFDRPLDLHNDWLPIAIPPPPGRFYTHFLPPKFGFWFFPGFTVIPHLPVICSSLIMFSYNSDRHSPQSFHPIFTPLPVLSARHKSSNCQSTNPSQLMWLLPAHLNLLPFTVAIIPKSLTISM